MSILVHIIKKIKQGNAGKCLLFACAGIFGSALYTQCYAQTNGPLTLSSPATTGDYSSNTSITFSYPFTTTGPFTATIQSIDCIPLTTNPTASQNFVMTTVPRIFGYTAASQLSGQGTCQVTQTIQYFDGIDRPIQTVQVKGSPFGNDVVQPIAYDQFGREATKYLPYALTTGANDGSYKTNALIPGAGQAKFYTIPPIGVTAISTPQAESNLELSPLNRSLEQGTTGDAWQLTGTVNPSGVTAGHTTKTLYSLNDSTTYWAKQYAINIDGSGNRTLLYQKTYSPNQLDVTIVKDENWPSQLNGDLRLNTTETYTDKLGHVVLKRRYNFTNAIQVLSTYYVYDDLGNLCYVLPPGANPDAGLTSANNQTVLNNLCYQYQYDSRDRITGKRIPGKDWEYTVYNSLDQLVLSQDAIQRTNNQWTVTKYDAFGRPIMAGLWSAGSAIPLATLQASIYSAAQWDTRDYTNNITGYNITSYPTITTILSISYYDNYNNIPSMPVAYVAPTGYNATPTGMPTATKTAVLNTPSDMLWSVLYYDGLGRNIKTYKQHYLGGAVNTGNYDAVVSTYDFTNAPTTTTRQHYTNASTTVPLVTIANQYLYDHIGRKLKTWEQIINDTTATTKTLLSKIDYNEMGQVLTKHLHSTDSVNFYQNIVYSYNERGWLVSSSAPLFAMQLYYNTGTNKQYNGNITYQYYGTPGNLNTSFTYSYDALNRLTSGVASDGYTENGITYDVMGNITALNRYRSGTLIDQLSYNYINTGGYNTNQLQTITDLSGNNAGIKASTTGLAYSYDSNGNVTVDPSRNTGTVSIGYNMLNLPQTITGAKTITYTYDAAGDKLRRVSPATGNTDYIIGIQYDGGALTFIQTEEGKAIPNGHTAYNFEYYLSDNLGNTRVTFDTAPGSVNPKQQDDYYPFGMEIQRAGSGTKNEYLYNKKELQEELGQYDYGARFYDPVIARWNTVDPLSEISRRWSPYNYAENNPIRFTDPDGTHIVYYANGTSGFSNDEDDDVPVKKKKKQVQSNTTAQADATKTDKFATYSHIKRGSYTKAQLISMLKYLDSLVPQGGAKDSNVGSGITSVNVGNTAAVDADKRPNSSHTKEDYHFDDISALTKYASYSSSSTADEIKSFSLFSNFIKGLDKTKKTYDAYDSFPPEDDKKSQMGQGLRKSTLTGLVIDDKTGDTLTQKQFEKRPGPNSATGLYFNPTKGTLTTIPEE